MPWIPFTEDAVIARMASREVEVYRATAEQDDVTPINRMEACVAQVLASFRGAIKANANVAYMGEAGTLPDFCIFHAAIIARNALIGLNPVPEGMTDPRRDEQREAERFLRDLRNMGSRAFEDDSTSTNLTATYGGHPILEF